MTFLLMRKMIFLYEMVTLDLNLPSAIKQCLEMLEMSKELHGAKLVTQLLTDL